MHEALALRELTPGAQGGSEQAREAGKTLKVDQDLENIKQSNREGLPGEVRGDHGGPPQGGDSRSETSSNRLLITYDLGD